VKLYCCHAITAPSTAANSEEFPFLMPLMSGLIHLCIPVFLNIQPPISNLLNFHHPVSHPVLLPVRISLCFVAVRSHKLAQL